MIEFFQKQKNRGYDINAYNEMIRKVNYQRARISHLKEKVRSRETKLASKGNFYTMKDQRTLASIYQNEVKHLALIKGALDVIELGLTSVSERVDTLLIIFKAFSGFNSVAKSVNDVIKYTTYLPSDFDAVLRQLVESHIELTSILHPPDARITFDLYSPEAGQIMAELEDELEKEVINRFPSVPLDSRMGNDLTEKMKEVVSVLAADGGTPTIFKERRKPKTNFEDRVLHHFSHQKGDLDVYGCAKYLRTSPQRVIEALYELADEGRLTFNN